MISNDFEFYTDEDGFYCLAVNKYKSLSDVFTEKNMRAFFGFDEKTYPKCVIGIDRNQVSVYITDEDLNGNYIELCKVNKLTAGVIL